jgi:hydrogenase nickel incorporation protein HypA/HybF
MHETSLAKKILEHVLARANGRVVRRIQGAIAEDEVLAQAALEFHFRAHARGTVAEAATLDLTLRHLSAQCKKCGRSFLPDHHVRICPECGSHETELEGEPGVFIASIDVDDA